MNSLKSSFSSKVLNTIHAKLQYTASSIKQIEAKPEHDTPLFKIVLSSSNLDKYLKILNTSLASLTSLSNENFSFAFHTIDNIILVGIIDDTSSSTSLIDKYNFFEAVAFFEGSKLLNIKKQVLDQQKHYLTSLKNLTKIKKNLEMEMINE